MAFMVDRTWAYHLVSPSTFKKTEVTIPEELKTAEVEVELLAAGICGTDIHNFKHGPGSEGAPPGFSIHECVGTVRRDPQKELEGQLVLAIPKEYSGLKGKYVADRDHCYGLSRHWLREHDQLAIATLVQPLATVLFALDRCGDLQGKTVVSVGIGPIGLLFGLVARVRGARRVVGIDPRLITRNVEAFGFDEIVEEESAVQASSFDLCIEAVGGQDATLVTALKLCCPDGRVLAFGVPSDTYYQVPFMEIFRKRLTLITSVAPEWSRYLPIAEAFIRLHCEAASAIVSHIFSIDRTQEAFDLVASSTPERRKVVLVT
ncbi:MAG TPA: zinc-binding dehydrogenase [Pseudonocardiaceae bacterium]|nr:zinc-binding dehydrogenase [Pseudonocardiaceae bacterium]